MKYNHLCLLLLLFCLVIVGLLPALSSYGWQGATQAAQDLQSSRKQEVAARKRMLQRLIGERRRAQLAAPIVQALGRGAPAAPTGLCDPGPSILLNQTLSG